MVTISNTHLNLSRYLSHCVMQPRCISRCADAFRSGNGFTHRKYTFLCNRDILSWSSYNLIVSLFC